MNRLTSCPFSLALGMVFIAYWVNGALIQGPLPMSVVAPIGLTAELNCTVNLTELVEHTGGAFVAIIWSTPNQALLQHLNPILAGKEIKTSILRAQLTEDYTSGVSVRCAVVTRSHSLSETPSNTSAILRAYGMYNISQNTCLVQLHVYTFSCVFLFTMQVVHSPQQV